MAELGLRRTTGNRVYQEWYRGFESLSLRHKKSVPAGGGFFVLMRDSTERPQNAAVRRFAAKRLCGRAENEVRSTRSTARYPLPKRNPSLCATSSRASLGSRRFVFFISKSSRRFVPPLLLSAKCHARFFCAVVNARVTKNFRYQHFAGNRGRIFCYDEGIQMKSCLFPV